MGQVGHIVLKNFYFLPFTFLSSNDDKEIETEKLIILNDTINSAATMNEIVCDVLK